MINERSRIIILNGVGSAGKSSIARALQTMTVRPFLHVEMDAFLAMLPPSMLGHPDGIVFEAVRQDGSPMVIIRTGEVARRAFRGMRHAIAAMAAQGNNMIVDEVMLSDQMAEYAALLAPFDLRVVGVFAPLEVLEARERQRGDRMPGLARWQYDRVHARMRYDLGIDTSTATAEESAVRIKQVFAL